MPAPPKKLQAAQQVRPDASPAVSRFVLSGRSGALTVLSCTM